MPWEPSVPELSWKSICSPGLRQAAGLIGEWQARSEWRSLHAPCNRDRVNGRQLIGSHSRRQVTAAWLTVRQISRAPFAERSWQPRASSFNQWHPHFRVTSSPRSQPSGPSWIVLQWLVARRAPRVRGNEVERSHEVHRKQHEQDP